MPTCLKCRSKFPKSIVIDGRRRNLQNRKYCFVCSPFGRHNTRNLVAPERRAICPVCGKDYRLGAGRTAKNCPSCYVTRARQNRKKRAVEYLGGSCQICGYNRCVQALVFHHVNGDSKEFNISFYSRAWEAIQRELDKCALLCANCHSEVHAGLVSLPCSSD